jgi:hippurate hydrolase
MNATFKSALLSGCIALIAACGSETGAGPGAAGGGGETAATASITSVPGMPVGPLRVADENLVALYKQLHETPELSFKEAQTAAILANELKTLGFTVTEGVGDAWVKDKSAKEYGEVRAGVGGYGVVGVFENGDGPVVLIRADMDALPVPENTGLAFASKVVSETWTGVESPVMHACGHDIHMTVWVGAARRLIAEKDKWKGTLIMIAQPAEEIGLGAQAMLADGLYSKYPVPDYNIALHVSAGAPAANVTRPSCR